MLKDNGYSTNMFHYNKAEYYNRDVMSKAFGYEAYHSFKDYEPDANTQDIKVEIDSYLTRNAALFNDVVPNQTNPFYSFIISYTAHLPYDTSVYTSKYALEKYPQYDPKDEFDVLRAKAHVTDDFLGELIDGLKKKGVWEDTVLVLYGDHYAYGINDTEKITEISEANGNRVLERTPALIYCADDERALKVEKTAQTVDLAPTLMNLLGLPVSHEVMGNDIFDPDYPGYAIFLKNGWVNDKPHYWCGDRNQSDVWEYNKPQCNDLHPTMKPIDLCARAVKNSSKKGQICGDFFGGSGSTLIACEQLGRICYMAELDPKYCDVILQRYENFTGDKPVLLERKE